MQNANTHKYTVIFFLVPNFSLIAFSSAVEPLRLANRYLPEPAYDWILVSSDGNPVQASNGVSVNVDGSIYEARQGLLGTKSPEMILVTSGVKVWDFLDERLNSWLRQMAKTDTIVGGLCTGAWVLAQAGLLEGKKCTIHWDTLPLFSEEFPEIEAFTYLFENDENIYSCAGGTASLDMMLALIDGHFGPELVNNVCEQALVDRTRSHEHRQRMPLRLRLGIHNAKLLFIIELMEANIANPLQLTELSKHSGLSRRQIERLFHKYLGRSPARYYLDLRLERARHILFQSELSIIEIGIACGFTSASHFSRCYRELYGCSPLASRKEIALAALDQDLSS